MLETLTNKLIFPWTSNPSLLLHEYLEQSDQKQCVFHARPTLHCGFIWTREHLVSVAIIPVLKEIGIFKIMFTFALNEFQIDLLLNTFVKRSYAYISLWDNTELVVVCINKITPQCKTEARSGDLHVDCDNLEKRHIKPDKKTFNFLLIVKYFCDKFKWWHKGINFTDRLKLLKNCWSFLMVWHLKELSWNESLWVKVHKHGNE